MEFCPTVILLENIYIYGSPFTIIRYKILNKISRLFQNLKLKLNLNFDNEKRGQPFDKASI
jgi:hypothetical protein